MKDQRGNNDLLNLTRPELVAAICEGFADAGADILATNTFNANAISQADYGAEHLVARDQPRRGADHPRSRRRYSAKDGKPRWVAGALGPTNKTLSLSPDVNDPAFREVDFDQVKAVYREQVDALVDGGVDFILIETIFDTLNAKAAIMATLEAEQALGRDAAADDLDDPDGSVRAQPFRPHGRSFLGVGPSCAAGHDRPQLLVRRRATAAAPRRAAAVADTLVMAYPNAGLPNELGEYDEAAAETAAQVREWVTAASSTSSAAAAGRPRSTSPQLPGRRAIARRAPSRPPPMEPCSPVSSRC